MGSAHEGLSRRGVLAGGVMLAAGSLAACSDSSRSEGQTSTPIASASPEAPAPSTPAAAWSRLTAGNGRWVKGNLDHPDRDPDRRELLAMKQNPYCVVLSCIDSRVPPELLFDVGLGDLFVLRTGAQVMGPLVEASAEYGPLTGGTPLIVVLGHQRCGAVIAAEEALRTGKALPGNLQEIALALRPAYEQVRDADQDRPDAMARAQVRLIADRLRGNADLASMVGDGRMAVVGAYYSLDTGEVEVLSGAPS